MATNRKRKSRKIVQETFSPKLRAFFEKGALADGNDPTNTTEDGAIFIMACSYKKTAEAYGPYRQEILADWKKQKRKGKPYAEKIYIEHGGVDAYQQD